MFVMMIQLLTKSMQDQPHIFLCICCRSFQIHVPVIIYPTARIDHDTRPGFVFQNLSVVSICDFFRCQTNVEFFLVWLSCLSFLTIYVLIWINIFLQFRTNFLNVSITESGCVFNYFG